MRPTTLLLEGGLDLGGLNVVDILNVGISGLVFLLAVLTYLLLKKEQEKPKPVAQMMRMIKLFMGMCVGLAVLVAGITVWTALGPGRARTSAQRCQESLNRLQTQRTLPDATADDLRAALQLHDGHCRAFVEEVAR